MPRYFFDIHHDTSQPDLQGEELTDKHAAWKEGTVIAGQILQDIDGKLKPDHDWSMEITDEFRNPLFVQRAEAEACLKASGKLRAALLSINSRSVPTTARAV